MITQHGSNPINRKRKFVEDSLSPNKRRALNIFTSTFFHLEEAHSFDIHTFRDNIQPEISNHIRREMESQGALKWFLSLKIEFEKTTVNGETDAITIYFLSRDQLQLTIQNLDTNYEEAS